MLLTSMSMNTTTKHICMRRMLTSTTIVTKLMNMGIATKAIFMNTKDTATSMVRVSPLPNNRLRLQA